MKQPSRVAIQLLLAAGAVVATGTAASSAEAPPCKGWLTAAEHTDAPGPIPAFESFCNGGDGSSFKQGFPIKWSG